MSGDLMAWYPGATRMELQPESDDQPAIRPTQLIVHSLAAPWDEQRTYEYWRDSTNLESHFGLDYDGSLGQFIGTETRADANAAANRRADGTGAISVETASNLHATDEWTDEQVEKLIRVGVWAHQTHGIELRLCRSADDPGFGWHKQFSVWNPSGHACPGPARIAQFKTVVFPGIVARATGTTTPEEDDMPTPQEYAKAVWDHRLASPTAAKGTDPTRPAGVFLSYGDAHHAQLVALVGAQTAAIAALAKGGGLDASEIQAAAETGAEAALDRLGIALTGGN